jgi:hypothetical protein
MARTEISTVRRREVRVNVGAIDPALRVSSPIPQIHPLVIF